MSLSGKIWRVEAVNDRNVLYLMQKYKMPEVLASLILRRGIDIEKVDEFLNPSLKDQLPEPYLLLGMEKAAQRVLSAIQNQEKIAIYADYDVDGATSSAIIRRYFQLLNIETDLYIPDRIEEGYGANSKALIKLKKNGINLVIMLDCGTTAHEPLEVAHNHGLDIIILDHHLSTTTLPKSFAIVNPNRFDQDCRERQDLKDLCTAGVAFLFLISLQRLLRREGFFNHRAEPDLRQYLDLVALGTICDVMPLKGLNRALVAKGLQVMRKWQNLGLEKLAEVTGIRDVPSAYHLGFILGPRINAGGRVGKADLGSRLLTTQDPFLAKDISSQLQEYNAQRQEIEKEVLEAAITQINDQNLHTNNCILAYGDGWHPGVIGVVAGRLKERYNKPVCVIAFDEEIGKGSGRSTSYFHLGNLMHTALDRKLLIAGGGHSMAAGLTIHKDKIKDFYDFWQSSLDNYKFDPSLSLDSYISIPGINHELWDNLCLLEPYGQANYTPRFAINNLRIIFSDVVGENHVRCQLQDEQGKRIDAIAFRALNTPLEAVLLKCPSPLLHVAGAIKLDSWNGKEKFKFHIEDIKLV